MLYKGCARHSQTITTQDSQREMSINNIAMEDGDDGALVSALNDYEHQEEAHMSDDEDEILIAALNNVEQQQQQQQQQQQEERTPARPADGELRRFLVGGGLFDEAETLSQGLDRLDQLYAEVLQDYNQQPQPSATWTSMEGERFIFYLFIIIVISKLSQLVVSQ